MTAHPKPISHRLLLGVALSLALVGCQTAADGYEFHDPATVEEVAGSDMPKITLTQSAVDRLALETETVRAEEGELVVSSDALIIDPDGGFWVYSSPEPLVYIRQPIEGMHQEGQMTYYSNGPEEGTAVVTVGVPELYGTESGIGH